MMIGVQREDHEKLRPDIICPRETLVKTQSALDAMRDRIQALELIQARIRALQSGQARIEDQLALLIRIQQPMARPTYAAQAPPSSRGTDPDTSEASQRRIQVVCAICAEG